MKLVKTASGKTTIKMSKSEWKSIGKKAGWLKEANHDDEDRERTCTGCGKIGNDVEPRYSFGEYAGRLCIKCCGKYRDNCGVGRPQGKVEDLDEFNYGGYDAIYGEDY